MIKLEKEYGCVSVWGIPIEELSKVLNSFLVGPSVDQSWGLLPVGQSLDELFETLRQLETTIEQRMNQTNGTPPSPLLPNMCADNMESGRGQGAAQNGQRDMPNLDSRGLDGLHKMDAANSIKRVKDTQRRNTQLSKMRELLFDNPNIGTAELAKELGVSKQTIRNLQHDLSGQLFSRGAGNTVPATTTTNGENFND